VWSSSGLLSIVQERRPLDHGRRVGVIVPLFCRGATIGYSSLAEAQSRRKRRANRASGVHGKVTGIFDHASAQFLKVEPTRPPQHHDTNDGKLGPRFYVVCESDRSFRAISAVPVGCDHAFGSTVSSQFSRLYGRCIV
jgi:hypothetical protein